MGHTIANAAEPLLDNFAEFTPQLQAMYEDPVKALTTNHCIRERRQGCCSVAKYASAFRLIAQDLAWNETVLLEQFQEGLADEILDKSTSLHCLYSAWLWMNT